MDYDRLFLRLFILTIIALVVFASTIAIGWFFEIGFDSFHLWLGAIIAFLTTALIYIAPFYWKIFTIFISIAIISFFIYSIFGWSILLSFLAGMAVVIFIVFAYLSI
ncbi:hypothetical protein JW752_03130 [Candidatus Peregrinibacteria bacterium]|nr:hypothetical protein [Candidatus Peregrinibacteria bacterium]